VVAVRLDQWSLAAVQVILKAVRDLYFARWGEPARTASFQVDEFSVDVYKWTAETTSEGVDLYATVGASAHPTLGRDPLHRSEFFLGLLPGIDAVASPLAALAVYAAREGKVVGHGDTVPSEGPLWPGTEMHRFLVMRPLGDTIQPLTLADGTHIEFLQALPIFESELANKTDHGAEALVGWWEQLRVPFWDPNRIPESAVE
jgi:hypothetical protein